MLCIQQREGDNWTEWHVGEPLPELRSRVITFQADGHELDMIQRAMHATWRPVVDSKIPVRKLAPEALI